MTQALPATPTEKVSSNEIGSKEKIHYRFTNLVISPYYLMTSLKDNAILFFFLKGFPKPILSSEI